MKVAGWRSGAALVVGLCCSAAQIGPGEAVSSKLVKFAVVALDNRGRPVSDLTAGDFQITDAGKPQQLTLFRHNDAKLQAARARPAPGEISNRGSANVPNATLILFDLMNESFSTRGGAQSYLIQGLKSLETSENLFLYLLTVNGKIYPVRPLPGSDTGIESAGSEPWTKNSKALIEQAVSKVFGLRPPGLDIDTRVRATYMLLESVARLMAAVPGRKNIVWITHGVPISLAPQATLNNDYIDYTPLLQRLAATLDRTGIAIYPVQQAPPGMAAEGTPEARYSGLGSEDTLKQFADLTGGGFRFAGDIGAAVRQAMTDARTSYVLGFQQPPEEWDGKFHKLHVTCARKGVRLQLKTGYWAGAEIPNEEQDELDQVMTSSFDAAEIGMRGKLTPEPDGKMVRIECRLDAADVQLSQTAGKFVGHLGIQVAGMRAEGGSSERTAVTPLDLNLTSAERDKALGEGILFDTRIPWNDAWRSLRVAVFDRQSHALGSLTMSRKRD